MTIEQADCAIELVKAFADYCEKEKNALTYGRTNLDRVHEMSAEELAKHIVALARADQPCDVCPRFMRGCDISMSCADNIVVWLNSPAKEEQE